MATAIAAPRIEGRWCMESPVWGGSVPILRLFAAGVLAPRRAARDLGFEGQQAVADRHGIAGLGGRQTAETGWKTSDLLAREVPRLGERDPAGRRALSPGHDLR